MAAEPRTPKPEPRFFEDTDLYRRHMADGPMPLPEVVQFEVTSECNLRCRMCPLASEHRDRPAADRRFTLDQVRALDAMWEAATEVELTGFGEIFTHPEILPILRHLRAKDLALYASSNGILLTPAVSEAIVAEGLLDVLCFSIDAATGPTYRRIRRGARWDVLRRNLAALRDAKERMGGDAPILFFSFCAMTRNIAELPDFVRMAHGYGARKVIVQHVVENRLTAGEGLSGRRDLAEPHRARARAIAADLGIELDMRNLDPVEEGVARAVEEDVLPTPAAFKAANRLVKDCAFPWEHVFVKSNHEAQICAILWEQMVMGDLRERSLAEIWNGEGYRRLRLSMCGTDAPEECVYCVFKGWRKPTPVTAVAPRITMAPEDAGRLGRGWHLPEQGAGGRWNRWAKEEATFFLKNDGSPRLRVDVFEHPEGPFLRGRVLAGGRDVARITSHDLWGGPLLIALPEIDDEFLQVTFRFDEAWHPTRHRGQAGRRRLTALFFGAELVGAGLAIAAKVAPGAVGSDQLGQGWYPGGDALGERAAWSQTRADVVLPAGGAARLIVQAGLPTGGPDKAARVSVNGSPVGDFVLLPDGRFHEHVLALPSSGGRRVVTFLFDGHRPDGTGDRAVQPRGAVFRRIELARPSRIARALGRV
jgi:MoaA/NifB/PqqE/SkfB family radical SAM enzyme